MTARDSALADQIVDLYKRGLLQSPFGVADISERFAKTYADSHIQTVLPNYCEGGYFELKYGTSPRFKRLSRGKYTCV
jgi:hypothetical protein